MYKVKITSGPDKGKFVVHTAGTNQHATWMTQDDAQRFADKYTKIFQQVYKVVKV